MDRKRIFVAATIAAVLLALFVTVPSGNPLGLIGLLLFGGAATWEFYGLLEKRNVPVSKRWGTAGGVAFLLVTWAFAEGRVSGEWLMSFLLLLVIASFFRVLSCPDPRRGAESAAGTLLGLVYVPLLWSCLVRLFRIGPADEPAWAALYVIVSMKIADSGGYLFGTKFGKRRLAPVLSPKKSWEGLAGGIALTLAFNILWMLASGGRLTACVPLSWADALFLSLFIPATGTLGDLVESMFKRAAGVKDSGKLVYGLGGVLDMIDSLLFAAPALYLYLVFIHG